MRLYKISVGGNYMKRLFLTGVAILLSVILLVGCQSRPINKTSLEDFEIWFDENGLDSQVNMMSYVETLTYKGKAIDCPCGAIDYVNGGGFKGETDDGTVGVEFSDFSNLDGSSLYPIFYLNTFYTTVNFDNLTFPGGLRIGDTFSRVMKTLMLSDVDPIGNFVADADDENVMTLKREGDASICYRTLDEDTKEIIFTLEQPYGEAGDRLIKNIYFCFNDDLELYRVDIMVNKRVYNHK
jgi:hypothetical protein